MATSTRIKILNPWRIWMLVTILNAALFGGATVMLHSVAEAENIRLARLQLDILVKSRVDDLDRGDFRSLASGLGGEASSLHIKVIEGANSLAIGASASGGHCAEAAVPLTRPDLNGVPRTATVTLCRPFSSPVKAISWIGGLFILVSAAGIIAAFRLDRAATSKLMNFFRDHGVKVTRSEGLAGVLGHFDDLNRSLVAARNEAVEAARSKAFSELAEQVAHDIRSPLAALKIEVDSLRSQIPPERRRILTGATERISDIAENLLQKNRNTNQRELSPHTLSSVLRPIIDEKQVEIQTGGLVQIEFSDMTAGSVATIEKSEFQRVISNLINNATEACADVNSGGRIKVTARVTAESVEIAIEDNGSGFSPQLLSLAGTRGFSAGKKNGHGLGLHHARKTIESFGGSLTVANNDHGGACVRILLPITQSTSALRCVLLDDDVFVREAWEHALTGSGGNILSFASYAELQQSLSDIAHDTPIFLDSDLSPEEKGEDLAQHLYQLGYKRLYLSTGYSPERFAGLPFLSGVFGKEPPSWLLSGLHVT